MNQTDERSAILPTDLFDRILSSLLDRNDGAHTQPAMVQSVDYYGNVSSHMVQTARWQDGSTVFVTQVDASGSVRYMLPPKVVAIILRQLDAITAQLRRRQGQRLATLAKANGRVSTFTPEMRAKAAATRKAKTAAKQARKAKKAARG